jgi:16S rRNA (uracil1498-N3)-methyltransferase
MPRYFVPDSCVTNGSIRIEGQAARHIAVSRRAKKGDKIEVADESGNAYSIKLDVVSDREVAGKVVESGPARGEPGLKVTLLQAISKDGMDEAVDAAVELGADRIVPVVTEHTVVRLDAKRAEARRHHWQEVALSAAEVAYRGRVPAVEAVKTLAQALEELPKDIRVLACAMTPEAIPLTSLALSTTQPLALIVGPEGGLSPSDLRSIHAARGELVHLGPRVLRARVAASHALAICMAMTGDLDDAVQQDRMH